jgi:hypothetical protein
MVEQNGFPPGGFDKDVIRHAISEVWHHRIAHGIAATPDEHIDALADAVFRSIWKIPATAMQTGLCGIKVQHLPHVVHTGSLSPFFCTADQFQREPGQSERRRLENQRPVGS